MVYLTPGSFTDPNELADLKVKLGSSLRGVRVTPAVPAGRKPRLSELDDLLPLSHGRDRSSGWGGFAVYLNAKGEVSERRISCRKLSGFGRVEIVHAFCHERQEVRSFRVDRFKELIDIDTGEVLDPIEHFEALRRQGALLMADKALTKLALILVFMARCDGEYHLLEREALNYCFSRYMLRFGGNDADIERLLHRCDTLAPDSGDFIRSLDALARAKAGPQIARLVLEGASSVIDADGYHHEAEVEWGVYVGQYFKLLAMR